MTAPEDPNGLREALARWLKEANPSWFDATCAELADALIAGPLASLIAERDEAVAGLAQATANIEKLNAVIHAAAPVLGARARRAEAENTRLKAGMEALKAKAEGQLAYWRERQSAEKALEDGVSEDGLTYTPMGDHAAWQGGYCNGRLSEADWWRWTLKELATLSPKEQPHG